ncbi:acyltransferase [Parabacteroides faecis]|uniref:Surface polysaccharide O-acyltransferase-like enzyme n=1 Tax=Parabacteroides faecis TaxID=1217282 RepID=A0ABR6KK00_9BACT|nr:acyltransferase family protein [Parabacteroides faecis]MBB4621816.1 surface polysaccharide O-acyltransferase-like enzyme [Parabacteroides faecis]GGJ83570.1 acyltransferase [Parabacteroides faecis]
MNNTTTVTRPHIVWLDVLRFVAILMVIACHCTDPFNASPESRANPDFNFWGSAYGSMLRACVPLFVMMTGFLLLPVKQEASVFYKKRIPRVFFPFLIWSVLFNLAPWFIQWAGGSAELVTDFFPYAPDPSASLTDALKEIAMIPVTFTVYATPMWYIYTLIGLYLYMPVFSAWVEKASDKGKRWFLGIWGVSLFIPYLMEFVSHYLFGTCSWNAYGLFYYFAGFNGYLLLGHYLGKGNDWSTGKTLAVTIPLFLIGYLVTFTGFRYMTSDPHVSEEGMELFFTYCSPNAMLMTAAIFLLVQKARISSPFICGALANLTKLGFGVYCVHYFFIGPSYLLTLWLGVPVPAIVPVSAIFTLAASWMFTYLLSKLPYSKYIIG